VRLRIIVLALAGTALIGADCDGLQVEEERRFVVSFVDAGANVETVWRSQDPPAVQQWDGTSNLHYLQLIASPIVSAQVVPAPGSGLPEDTVVFLDAPGQAADISGVVESTGSFGQRIVPGEYDVFVAPGRLISGQPATRFVRVTLNDETPDWAWQLPSSELVEGVVKHGADGVVGPLVVPYPRDFGGMPLGSWGEALEGDDEFEDGEFQLSVPPGVYDVVLAPQLRRQDNGILQPDPIAPVFLSGRDWPVAPLAETIPVQPLRVTSVVGRVRAAGADVTAVSRIRIEGTIPALSIGLDQWDGARWIADLRTDGEGVFRVDVPQGQYRVTAIPVYTARDRDVGVHTFAANGGTEDFEVALSAAPVATIGVVDELGAAVPDASLYIRNTGPPRYAYGERTQALGAGSPGFWFGTLMRGTYTVEVVPPVDTETGAKIWARAHGELEVSRSGGATLIQLRRSAIMNGLVFSLDQRPVDDMLVEVRDWQSGELLDQAVTNRTNERGFFRALLPEEE
jgi:hypothetical protein